MIREREAAAAPVFSLIFDRGYERLRLVRKRKKSDERLLALVIGWGEVEEKKSKIGCVGVAGGWKNQNQGGAGGSVLVRGEKIRLLGFLLCVPSPQNYQMTPPFLLSFEPIFIGKMLSGTSNWSLNFFLFANLILS